MKKLIVMGDPVEEGSRLHKQIQNVVNTPEVIATRMMADKHLGYGMPIGGVAVTEGYVNPGWVGYDIGCGNYAAKTGLTRDMFSRDDLLDIGHEIKSKIAFGPGVGFGTFVDYPDLKHWISETKHIGLPEETIINQFGSVGSGNHYIDLMYDQDGYVWVALHFGSRKLGHAIASHYLKALGAKDDIFAPAVFVEEGTALGDDYLHDMRIAGQYATVARRIVAGKVVHQILRDTIWEIVENHHNYAWEYDGLFVTRKGATPVHPGVPAFIGGSMGNESAIVVASEDERNTDLFYSAPHGAGRVLGRMQAKGKWDKRNNTWKREPKVTQEMMDTYLDDAGVVRVGGGVDESPHVYRNLLTDVLPHYPWLEVTYTLTPMLAVMA